MEIIFASKRTKIIAIVSGLALFGLVSLIIGMAIGFYKAKFSCDWGRNYERNFMNMSFPPQGQNGPMVGGFSGGKDGFPFPDRRMLDGGDFRNPHGLAGEVLSVSEKILVIKDKDEKENSVSITDKTLIKRGRDTIKITDLKQGDKVVVLGRPNEDSGTVEADLIRVLDKDMENFPMPRGDKNGKDKNKNDNDQNIDQNLNQPADADGGQNNLDQNGLDDLTKD